MAVKIGDEFDFRLKLNSFGDDGLLMLLNPFELDKDRCHLLGWRFAVGPNPLAHHSAPDPLKIGDRVSSTGLAQGTIKAIWDDWAWVLVDRLDYPVTYYIKNLKRVE